MLAREAKELPDGRRAGRPQGRQERGHHAPEQFVRLQVHGGSRQPRVAPVKERNAQQPEAAEVVGVSEKTVQRRLKRARVLLAERLADLRPDTSGGPDEAPPRDTPTP